MRCQIDSVDDVPILHLAGPVRLVVDNNGVIVPNIFDPVLPVHVILCTNRCLVQIVAGNPFYRFRFHFRNPNCARMLRYYNYYYYCYCYYYYLHPLDHPHRYRPRYHDYLCIKRNIKISKKKKICPK